MWRVSRISFRAFLKLSMICGAASGTMLGALFVVAALVGLNVSVQVLGSDFTGAGAGLVALLVAPVMLGAVALVTAPFAYLPFAWMLRGVGGIRLGVVPALDDQEASRHRGWLIIWFVVLLIGASAIVARASRGEDDPWSNVVGSGWMRGHEIVVDDEEPARRLLPYREPGGRPCIAQRVSEGHSSGGMCFPGISTEPVDAATLFAGSSPLLVGFAAGQAEVIEIPDGAVTLRLRPQASFTNLKVFWVSLRDGLPHDRRVVAFDERDRMLGSG